MANIEQGNMNDLVSANPEQRGWVLGHFIPGDTYRHSDEVEVKWAQHEKGYSKMGKREIVSTKTLTIVLSGRYKIHFPEINKELELIEQGDYIIYDAGEVLHSFDCIDTGLTITVRWPSLR